MAASGLGETALSRWSRRAVSISSYVLLWAVALAAAPLALLAFALTRRSTPRLFLYAAVFLSYEGVGLAASFWLWLTGRSADREAHGRLQRWWACGLFRAAACVFDLELSVEGGESVEPGPLVVLIRHASLADTLLPEVVLADRHGIRLRYVLKRELLFDPCLDVVGQRLGCAFIQRGSGESEREIGAIAALGRGLGPSEGALIYPEGTRFEERKRVRALERIAAAGQSERLARVRGLRHVLPVRSAGPLALVEAAAPADVLFVAHTGLEGLASVADLLGGGIVGRKIRVALWRTPRSVIPEGREALLRWLDEEWARVDAFVESARKEAVVG